MKGPAFYEPVVEKSLLGAKALAFRKAVRPHWVANGNARPTEFGRSNQSHETGECRLSGKLLLTMGW
jgi:hypothetical protein